MCTQLLLYTIQPHRKSGYRWRHAQVPATHIFASVLLYSSLPFCSFTTKWITFTHGNRITCVTHFSCTEKLMPQWTRRNALEAKHTTIKQRANMRDILDTKTTSDCARMHLMLKFIVHDCQKESFRCAPTGQRRSFRMPERFVSSFDVACNLNGKRIVISFRNEHSGCV